MNARSGRSGLLTWCGLTGILVLSILAGGTLPAADEARDRKVKLTNHVLNKHVRLLDGQWQGTHVASDGKVYLGGASHNPKLGAAFFRYDPKTKKLKMLAENITFQCGEDPTKTPPQGKIHSPVVEHKGWLYFGTHLADYSKDGMAAYTGAHLIGYELASEKFRDLGVVRKNYTNYAAIGLDAKRGKIYFYVTPFGKGDGSHLYRVDIKTGEKEDLGLVDPWTNRRSHGPPAYHCMVDGRGDCWLTVRGKRTLFVARGATGKLEAHENALPEAYKPVGQDPWTGLRALDGDRAVIQMGSKLWIFNTADFNSGKKAFTVLKEIGRNRMPYIAVGGGRVFWTDRSGRRNRGTMRLHSVSLEDPSDHINHGRIVDAQGRTPQWPGDLITDGKGGVYMIGRWNVRPEDMKTIGVLRHGMRIAVFFSVMDVSEDLSAGKKLKR